MFLGVSAKLGDMPDMTEGQRQEMAQAVRAARIERFGSKSAAYRAAELNATTWDRIESGERVREDRMIAAVKTLWPDSGGDWRRVLSSGPEVGNDIDALVRDLQRRMEAVERAVFPDSEGSGGDVEAAPIGNDDPVAEADGDAYAVTPEVLRDSLGDRVRDGDTPG